MDEELRLLTLTQPWATLVAIGAKRIETRGWPTRYRGWLAIHAAQGLGPVGGRRGLFDQAYRPLFREALEPAMETIRPIAGHPVPHYDADRLPRGCIVAVAWLADVVPTIAVVNGAHPGFGKPNSAWPLTEQERAFGDYRTGRYAWLLADVKPLREPLPYRGAQGLRRLPGEVAAEVWRRAA